MSEFNGIESESISIGKISFDEMRNNQDIVQDKVEHKISEILDKYGFTMVVSSFGWDANGQVQAQIDIVKKYEE